MRILLTGSHGLIGLKLKALLAAQGHTVVILSRSKTEAGSIYWDPARGDLDPSLLEHFDGVVHLAGENIAAQRWTDKTRKKIRDSRVQGTRLLSAALAQLSYPPQVLVSASAVGFYGDRGNEILNEQSLPGSGFLAQLCQEWEEATSFAVAKEIRVVLLRIGIVLAAQGGALTKMLPLFLAGLGGQLGSGKQYMSWITLDDVAGVINHTLITPELAGPVNAVSPYAVTNLEFTKTLGNVLGRPTILPVPRFGIRLVLGEMADELLLASAKVEPLKLKQSGYQFQAPELKEALTGIFARA